jgi:hypothetical protein
LLVPVVGDRHVEGPENLGKLLVACGVERRAQVVHGIEHRRNLVGVVWATAPVRGPSTVAGLGINPASQVHLRR